jgi:uncharacterized alkaline shock family protein YloU
VEDLVRSATLGSYGVTGFASPLGRRLLAMLGVRQPGIQVSVAPELTVDLDLTVAPGLPIAEVARQVDSAVRYSVERATGRPIDRLTIHVGGLRWQPGTPTDRSPAASASRARPRSARRYRDGSDEARAG